jgi:hypothetical protein
MKDGAFVSSRAINQVCELKDSSGQTDLDC